MTNELESLPKTELIPLLLQARETIEKQQSTNQALEQNVLYLKYQVEHLSRMLYGQKRERFEKPELPQLPFEEEPQKEEENKTATVETIKVTYQREKRKVTKPHPGRHPLPEHLRVEEETIEPIEDTTDMVRIGEEITDTLAFKPAEFYIHRIIRPKYARKNKEGVIIAKLPERPFGKTMASTSLLTYIMVSKYVDHLPLYRIIQIFKREKIPIAANTVDSWVKQAGEFIQILYDYQKKKMLSAGYLQVDETTIRVLDHRDTKGKTHLGYYWVCYNPIDKSVHFEYHPGRSQEAGKLLLGDFANGYLQTDGYVAYPGIVESGEGITHLCCWAHARREFEKALSNDEARAEIALGFIQSLYKIERQAREKAMTAAQRKELRLEKSLPILNAMGKWLTEQYTSGQMLPNSPINKAFAYALNRWEQLMVYLQDGTLEIDNNLVENAIRPIAIGRKNYLFAGSHEGAKRAAAFYSFFAMCKANDVNPTEWLQYVLDNLPDANIQNLDQFLPRNFKK